MGTRRIKRVGVGEGQENILNLGEGAFPVVVSRVNCPVSNHKIRPTTKHEINKNPLTTAINKRISTNKYCRKKENRMKYLGQKCTDQNGTHCSCLQI
jgi:hypothetical protein